ncbi:MAG: hypothetical protein JWL84_3555 [Rhodospirillales bacterium]|jgi:hypothetical protein|nr:hypothetical protein [Rhodospirillales bacterium]
MIAAKGIDGSRGILRLLYERGAALLLHHPQPGGTVAAQHDIDDLVAVGFGGGDEQRIGGGAGW